MGISRRAFLQLGAALGAAFLQQTSFPSTAPLRGFAHAQRAPTAGSLSIASTFPLPFQYRYFSDAERLLDYRLDVFDLLLVPAYTAGELIRRGALQTLPGVPGRPHDPDGAYTFPYLTAISALVYRGARPSSLDDLWARDALWPDSPRLVIGAALLRRGYPLNDSHSGHLAQAEEDLLQLRPRLASDPLVGWGINSATNSIAKTPCFSDDSPDQTLRDFAPRPLAAFRSGLAAPALTLIRIEAISSAPTRPSTSPPRGSAQEATGTRAMIPPEGAAIVEYDWVVPLGARRAEAALAFIANAPSGTGDIAKPPRGTPHAFDASAPKLTPLTPLPAAALAQRASIWKRLKETTP